MQFLNRFRILFQVAMLAVVAMVLGGLVHADAPNSNTAVAPPADAQNLPQKAPDDALAPPNDANPAPPPPVVDLSAQPGGPVPLLPAPSEQPATTETPQPLPAPPSAGVSHAAPQQALLPTGGNGVAGNGGTLVSTSDRAGSGTAAAGYFPTQDDSIYLGDSEYPRSTNGMFGGPDDRAIKANGLFPYQNNRDDFFDRNAEAFKPIDRVLGFLSTDNQGLLIEDTSLQDTSWVLSVGLPALFTRGFDPDHAMVKAGPLYLDLLWFQTAAIWSTYHGAQTFAPGEGPGWTAEIELAMRAYMRLTDEFYLVGALDLIYLPIINKFGFEGGAPYGMPQIYTRMEWARELGEWDVSLMDQFTLVPGLDFNLYQEVGSHAIDNAGRYSFGFYHQNSDPVFSYENDEIVWTNQITARAARLLLDNQWLFSASAEHSDDWQGSGFDNHGEYDHFRAMMAYEGSQLLFSPTLYYDFYGSQTDGSAYTIIEEVGVRFHGRLTENISAQAETMYEWSSSTMPDQRNWAWDATITQQLTPSTQHYITGGQGYQENSQIAESLWADYVGYGISQRITPELSIAGTAQWARQENFGMTSTNTETFGLSLSYRPLDFTFISVSAYYEHEDQPGSPQSGYNHWLYQASVSQVLASRLTLQLFYQYESLVGPGGFGEHAVGVALRRYF